MEQDWQPYSLNKQNTHNRNSEKNVNKIIQGGANVDTVKKYNAGHNHNHAVQNVGKKAEAEETKRKSNLPPPTNQVVYFVQSS